MEHFGGTLASSDHRNRPWSSAIGENVVDGRRILRRVDDPGMIGIQTLRYTWPPTGSDDNILRSSGDRLAGVAIVRSDTEVLNSTGLGIRTTYVDGLDIVPIIDEFVKVAGTPPHVILVFNPLWEKSAKVGELYQSIISVEVVDEGEFAPWIP